MEEVEEKEEEEEEEEAVETVRRQTQKMNGLKRRVVDQNQYGRMTKNGDGRGRKK